MILIVEIENENENENLPYSKNYNRLLLCSNIRSFGILSIQYVCLENLMSA